MIVLSNVFNAVFPSSFKIIFATYMRRTGIILAFILCSIFVQAQSSNNNALPEVSAQSVINKGRFIKVFCSKSKVYAGEPFQVTYKFYEQITSRPSVLQQPDFNGFSVQELPYENGAIPEIFDGEMYKAYIIRKVQLTAPEAGKHILSASTVEDIVTLPDPADASKEQNYTFTVSNPQQFIEVLPLPANTRPADFYGITGNFSMQAAAAKDTLALNETGHLLITITGSGNIDAINMPLVKWPAGIEHFEGSDTQHIISPDFPISGDRVFDIPFLSKKEGLISLPPVYFVFFNPQSQKYQSIHTNSIAVNFSAAAVAAQQQPVYQDDITNRKYLWIVPAIAAVVAFGGFVSYRRNKKAEAISKTYKQKQAAALQQKLKQQVPVSAIIKTDSSAQIDALKNETDKNNFFTGAKKIIANALAENSITDELKNTAEMFLKKCDYYIYSPVEEGFDVEKLVGEMRRLMKGV